MKFNFCSVLTVVGADRGVGLSRVPVSVARGGNEEEPAAQVGLHPRGPQLREGLPNVQPFLLPQGGCPSLPYVRVLSFLLSLVNLP